MHAGAIRSCIVSDLFNQIIYSRGLMMLGGLEIRVLRDGAMFEIPDNRKMDGIVRPVSSRQCR